eukprot:1185735-Prorocentrum_minimum.AAC.1
MRARARVPLSAASASLNLLGSTSEVDPRSAIHPSGVPTLVPEPTRTRTQWWAPRPDPQGCVSIARLTSRRSLKVA